MQPNPPSPSSEAERIQRIGELICKAIIRSRAEPVAGDVSGPVDESPIPEKSDRRIVAYLRQTQEAAPGEMGRMLNLSRATVHRTLQRLLAERRVVAVGGRTSAAAYRLAEIDPSRN